MICGNESTSGLTAQEADLTEQEYRSVVPPPLKVSRSQAADGTWTVTAEFPPCPAENAQDDGTPAAADATMQPTSGGRPPEPTPVEAAAQRTLPATPATSSRGNFAIDSFNPVSAAAQAAAAGTPGGGTPAFWGRYFYAPGRVNSSGKVDLGHYSAAENRLLRSNNIRLLPICRQTAHVGQGSAEGARDAALNVAALFEVFPPSYLSGADPDVLMFLDSECSTTQPTLSASYFAGWSAAIVQLGSQLSNSRVHLHPAVYGSHSDNGAWSALRSAIQDGAACDGVWVAAWNTTPSMVDWSDARTIPAGGLPCPVLAWQYSDRGAGFDTDTTNPAHDDMLMSRLVMPPP